MLPKTFSIKSKLVKNVKRRRMRAKFQQRHCRSLLIHSVYSSPKLRVLFHPFFFVDETWLSAKNFMLSDLYRIHFHTRSNAGIMAGNSQVPFLSPACIMLLFFVLVFVWFLSLRNIHVSLSGRRHPCLFLPAGFCKCFFLIFIYIYRSPSDLMGPWHLLIGNALASSQYKLNKLQCHLQIIYSDILEIQMMK